MFREGFQSPMSFKEKIIHRYTAILLQVDIMQCYVYDTTDLLNHFDSLVAHLVGFSFTSSFIEHVVLVTLSFPSFQVKHCSSISSCGGHFF